MSYLNKELVMVLICHKMGITFKLYSCIWSESIVKFSRSAWRVMFSIECFFNLKHAKIPQKSIYFHQFVQILLPSIYNSVDFRFVLRVTSIFVKTPQLILLDFSITYLSLFNSIENQSELTENYLVRNQFEN